MVYNNSLKNKTIISVPITEYMIGYKVELNGKTAEYFFKDIKIDYLDNGFPYGNITNASTQSIFENSSLFHRLGNKLVINSTDMSDLKIYAITPYYNQEINYKVINMSSPPLNSNIVKGLFNIFALICFGIVMIKYLRGNKI